MLIWPEYEKLSFSGLKNIIILSVRKISLEIDFDTFGLISYWF